MIVLYVLLTLIALIALLHLFAYFFVGRTIKAEVAPTLFFSAFLFPIATVTRIATYPT